MKVLNLYKYLYDFIKSKLEYDKTPSVNNLAPNIDAANSYNFRNGDAYIVPEGDIGFYLSHEQKPPLLSRYKVYLYYPGHELYVNKIVKDDSVLVEDDWDDVTYSTLDSIRDSGSWVLGRLDALVKLPITEQLKEWNQKISMKLAAQTLAKHDPYL